MIDMRGFSSFTHLAVVLLCGPQSVTRAMLRAADRELHARVRSIGSEAAFTLPLRALIDSGVLVTRDGAVHWPIRRRP